jgi:hypothetical protein
MFAAASVSGERTRSRLHVLAPSPKRFVRGGREESLRLQEVRHREGAIASKRGACATQS